MKAKILSNLISVLLILILANFACLKLYNSPIFSYVPTEKIVSTAVFSPKVLDRGPFGEQYKKNGEILVLGCSFVYGTDTSSKTNAIPIQDTFSYKLANYSKKYVHSRGWPSGGLSTALYLFQRPNYYFNNVENPQYVIYNFIDDHVRRIFTQYMMPYDSTRFVIGYSVFQIIFFDKFKLRSKSTIDSLICNSYFCKSLYQNLISFLPMNIKFFIVKRHLLEINRLSKERWPNSKFAVILYPNIDLHGFKEFETNKWSELEKEGIQIIRFNDEIAKKLKTDYKYLATDRVHPSGLAWDLVVPEICKQLNIK